MPGQGATRRGKIKQARKRQALKKAERREAKQRQSLGIPDINEDDLLAFQISHFGDNAQPNTWFVDAETALDYDPALEDDCLGYYNDGAKRMLTDEQIDMFRHSEIEQLIREGRLEREVEPVREDHDGDAGMITDDADNPRADDEDARSVSVMSDTSSIEEELEGLAQPRPRVQSKAAAHGHHSPVSSIGDIRWTRNGNRRREGEVPYDERHKRKWEDYIDENDPVEGSLTHRRIVRELDEQHEETIDLDY